MRLQHPCRRDGVHVANARIEHWYDVITSDCVESCITVQLSLGYFDAPRISTCICSTAV
jgi:hypothetical protein